MMKTVRTAVTLTLLFALAAFACQGAMVFHNGHGARALAMGGAFTAIADDFSAAMWNPAGLVLIQPSFAWIGGATANLYGAGDFEGIGYQYMAGGMVLGDMEPVIAGGASYAYADAGMLYRTGVFAMTGSFAFATWACAGVSVKYYSETIGGDTETGIGADVGLLWVSDFGWRVGVVAFDMLGTTVGENQFVDPVFKLGAAYTIGLVDSDGYELTLSGDFEVSQSDRLHGGAELVLLDVIALRCGASIPLGRDGDVTMLSGGVGITIGGLTIDAAYIHDGPLGQSWILAAAWLF